ncbi:MAG: D-glycerate dehydrogenase, partial [Planctomycetota bacterium]
MPGPLEPSSEGRSVDADVDMGPAELPLRDAVLARLPGASVIVTMFSDRVDAEFLDAAGPTLKGVCNFAVGFDNIDLDECRTRGIAVCNTPDAVTEGTADLAWTLILAAARRLIEADRFARSDAYPAGGPLGMGDLMGMDLTGRTLLIVGAGRIGFATALRSVGWGMRVLYVARRRHPEFEHAPLGAERVELDEGLRRADVVSLHAPLTEQTRHMLHGENIALLKPTAIVVNVARGPVVDESALADALERGAIWGVGLDVFEREPTIDPRLIASNRAVLTPHIGSA